MNNLLKNIYYIIPALFAPVIICLVLAIAQNASLETVRLLSFFGFIALFVGLVTLIGMAIERNR
jgi:hypothetical protein